MPEVKSGGIDAMIINPQDNVAVCLKDIPANMEIVVSLNGNLSRLKALDAMATGHKIALRDIRAGENVIKYAEVIGKMKEDVAKGRHIHVHNITD